MNKSSIKNFAILARNKLRADIAYRASLMGITESGIEPPLDESTSRTEFYSIGTATPYSITGNEIEQRRRLSEAVRAKEKDSDYCTAYNSVIEETAYTWFNRLIAIRFMEVNDYLPSRIRVLSSETGKLEPDIVSRPFDSGLHFTPDEREQITELKLNNDVDEAFRLLFIKQCNELGDILPHLFEKPGDYTELLLNISVIDQDGVIYHLVHDIPEEDWTEQVEIIGWMYQYYISEKHEEVVNIYKGNVKQEDVPAATQLFTTDWVVRYMVDNSLGRYWIERHPESNLADKLQFFVKPKNGKIEYIDEKVAPGDLTFIEIPTRLLIQSEDKLCA